MKMKKCTKCGEEKPDTVEYFCRKSRYASTLRPDCKVCHNKLNKIYREKNKRVRRKRSEDGKNLNNDVEPNVTDNNGLDTVTNCQEVRIYCYNRDDGCKKSKLKLIDLRNTKRLPRYICPICQEFGSPSNRMTESG